MKNYTDMLIEDYLTEGVLDKYFVICMMQNYIEDFGTIEAVDAQEAMDNFFANSEIVKCGEYDNELGEFDEYDYLTRYAWKVEPNTALPTTLEEAEAWLNANRETAVTDYDKE